MRSQLAQLRLDIFLHHPNRRHHDDDRKHADQDSHHRQRRAKLVRRQRMHGHPKTFDEFSTEQRRTEALNRSFQITHSSTHRRDSSAPLAMQAKIQTPLPSLMKPAEQYRPLQVTTKPAATFSSAMSMAMRLPPPARRPANKQSPPRSGTGSRSSGALRQSLCEYQSPSSAPLLKQT